MKRGKRYKDMSFERFRERIPPHMRWMVDQDYIDKLGPKEREWLLKYLDEEYRASFRKDESTILQGQMKLDAQNRVRSLSEDRRPDLMSFAEDAGYKHRRQSLQPDPIDTTQENQIDGQIYDAMEGPTKDEIEDEIIDRIDAKKRRR